jgi:hypothetical protein
VKFLPSQLSYFFQGAPTRRNVARLLRFVSILAGMVAVFSVLFHYIMEYEGRYYTWTTGVYWTLTVMSTLGFGDITFHSDLGRVFSILVLMSGLVFLLVMLPFTFIQFFYAPWLEAQSRARAPRELPEDTAGHVILAGCSVIAINTAVGMILNPDPDIHLHLGDELILIGSSAAEESFVRRYPKTP